VPGTVDVGSGPSSSADDVALGVGGAVGLTVGPTIGTRVSAPGAAQPPTRTSIKSGTRYREWSRVMRVTFQRVWKLSYCSGLGRHYTTRSELRGRYQSITDLLSA
jgi:hypothetical protein